MSSQTPVIIASLSPKDKQARTELLTLLQNGSENALKNEPGTLRYAFATSRDDKDENIYVVEKYADQAALRHHMEQAQVQDMLKWMNSGNLAGEPELFMLDQAQGLDFIRPQVKTHPDPLLIVTDLGYKPDTAESTIPYWKAVFETTRDDEQGALLWQLAKDQKNPDRLLVVHAYESRDYLMSVHAISKALKESQAHGKEIQTGIKVYFLKVVGGYLYRETK